MQNKKVNFAFFGTGEFSVIILDELEKASFVPKVVVCGEDKPIGRKLIITPPEVKVWAEKRKIPVFQPATLRAEGLPETLQAYSPTGFDIFIVASYGKIIPQTILDIPKHGALNVHPSLLPKLRGASPIESAILQENETGVSIMVLDEQMDHGPIVAQEKSLVSEWPPYADDLEKIAGRQGGVLLAEVIPGWIQGTTVSVEQNHEQATYCKKINKEDGLLDLKDTSETNLRKIRAYKNWPKAYYFLEQDGKKSRIIVTEAHIENNELVITKIIPEGRKEMSYTDFVRNR